MAFDPDGAAPAGTGIFGLPPGADARFVVIPVPFDATTSYRDGARHGPAAVLAASRQVDLHDLELGHPWMQGIRMLPLGSGPARELARMNARARRLARPVIAAGGDVGGRPALARAVGEVNGIGARAAGIVEAVAEEQLRAGRVPVVLGGDHASPLGAIRACARHFPGMGILHVDAHADLRDAYEGFRYSHASIMHNVVTSVGRRGGVATVVQVGLRDVGEREVAMIEAHQRPSRRRTRILVHPDARIQAAKMAGTPFRDIASRIVRDLPRHVYVSLDIDGLDPALCPDTGTPVPGGLSFAELMELLRALLRGRRRIVGFDLSEVAPRPGTPPARLEGDWNGNVGARVLYKLLGAAALSARPGRTTGS
jgi:agmatinase